MRLRGVSSCGNLDYRARRDPVHTLHRWTRLALVCASVVAFWSWNVTATGVASSPGDKSSQKSSAKSAQQAQPAATGEVDPGVLQSLHWRAIGPFRGGLPRAGAGGPSRPNVFSIRRGTRAV